MALRTWLIGVAKRAGAPPLDAEDLVHEALCRALSSELLTYPRAWLQTVVRNLAVDSVRANQRLRRHMTALTETGRERDLLEDLEDTYLARSLEQSLCSLPFLQSEAIRASSRGVSMKRFAAEHGITDRAAEGHLRRGRACLRRRALA